MASSCILSGALNSGTNFHTVGVQSLGTSAYSKISKFYIRVIHSLHYIRVGPDTRALGGTIYEES